MKKIGFAVSALSAFLLFSCGGAMPGGMTDKAKKNLEASQAVMKMFESGDYSKAGDYIATDAVDHAGSATDVKGLDSIKASFVRMGQSMGDFKNEVVKEMADDDYTFQWAKESATMKVDDPMMGKAGSRGTYNAIEVSKFNADGKISEHWTFMDTRDMMGMMMNAQKAMGGMNMMEQKVDSPASKMAPKK